MTFKVGDRVRIVKSDISDFIGHIVRITEVLEFDAEDGEERYESLVEGFDGFLQRVRHGSKRNHLDIVERVKSKKKVLRILDDPTYPSRWVDLVQTDHSLLYKAEPDVSCADYYGKDHEDYGVWGDISYIVDDRFFLRALCEEVEV